MPKTTLTIPQILHEFDKFAQHYEYNEKTAKLYKSMINAFLVFMKNKSLDFEFDVSNTVFNEYFKSRNNIRIRTKKVYVWLMNEIFTWLVDKSVIENNPMDNVRNLFVKTRGVKEKLLPVVLTKTEMQTVIEHNFKPYKNYADFRKQVRVLLAV